VHLRRLFYASLLFVSAMAASSQSPGRSPTLTISPADVVFPATPVGSEDAPQTITITNSTNSSIQLQEVIVSGIDFGQSNDCSKELAGGAKCSIQIVFKPAIPGERVGNLEVVASDSSVPHFVALNGTGE
jgi:Transmembrane protein 131-like N-terminal